MTFENRIHSDALRAFYACWQTLRRDDSPPARADIDPRKISAILHNIGLFDVETAPRRYRIRLIGIEIVKWYGSDLTGCYLDEIDFGERQSTFALLDQVVDGRVAGYMSGSYTKQDGRTIRYERLFVPLSNDGRHVDMLIGASFALPADVPIRGDSLDR